MAVINIRVVQVDLIIKIAPWFCGPFVTTYKKGETMIIIKFMNAIYGTMVASLIEYKDFLKALKRNVFQLNPYDPCVEHPLVNDKQQTICFHVDD